MPRHGLSPIWPKHDRRDLGVSDVVGGGLGSPNTHGPFLSVPIPLTAQSAPEGLRCIRPCVGRARGPLVYGPHTGRPVPRTAHARPEGLGCICRCGGGGGAGARRSIIRGHPTGRPYPPNGLGKTRGTRVYPPLCGVGCKSSHTLPPRPRGVLITQTAQAGPEGRRCICRCVERSWKSKHALPSRTGGTQVYHPLCGRRRRVNHTRPPHGAPPCPKRRRQDRSDSGVNVVVWRGVESPNLHGPPAERHDPPNGPCRSGVTRVYPPLCGEGLEG